MGGAHHALTGLFTPLENRCTSPELIERYWADFQIGDVSAVGSPTAVLKLLQEPCELAPLLAELSDGLLGQSVITKTLAVLVPNASQELAAPKETIAELVYEGLNYLQLLNALTLHLDMSHAALRALLTERMADVVLAEIPYANFFDEAKCKGVYWSLHLSSEAQGEVVSSESAARLLHANILMAVVSEALGPRYVGVGQENASCGYLLAERVAIDGLDAISTDWRAVYHSWNAAFMMNSPCPNMDYAKIAATALLLPALINARSGTEWLRRRAISLMLALISSFHRNSSLLVETGASDSVPFSASRLESWGAANRDALHEAGLMKSYDRGTTLIEMTRVTRQARAMNRFLNELRGYDSKVRMTLEEGWGCAVDLAAKWQVISKL